MNEENLCILIDFENIAAGTERENLGKFNTKLVMNHLKEKGRVLISRAYGDWGRFAKFKQALLEQGISMMELTSYRGQDKNRADIALVVDAMELVFSRPHIQTYVLLSGDSDFTPLVQKLRELNKRIIGMGTRKATSRLLADSCDEFIFYDNLVKQSEPDEESTDESITPKRLTAQEAYTILVETIQAIQRDEPRPIPAGMVKQFILRKHPTFNENDCGYSGFTDFLEAASKSELVHLLNNDKGGGYLVTIKDTRAPQPAKIEQPVFSTPLAGKWADLMEEMGLHLTNHFLRHHVVHEFVDHVLERRIKKKRSTLVFTYGDVARRCRKTSPPASTSEVEHILNALLHAGELYGPDQKPTFNKKTNFTIKARDAEELLEKLRRYYLRRLLEKVDIEIVSENTKALCEFLWNDLEHETETSEILEFIKNNTVVPSNTILENSSEGEDHAAIKDSSSENETSVETTPSTKPATTSSNAKRGTRKTKSPSKEVPKQGEDKEAAIVEPPSKSVQKRSKPLKAKQNRPLNEEGNEKRNKVTEIDQSPSSTNEPSALAPTPAEEPKKTKPKRRTIRKKSDTEKQTIEKDATLPDKSLE